MIRLGPLLVINSFRTISKLKINNNYDNQSLLSMFRPRNQQNNELNNLALQS